MKRILKILRYYGVVFQPPAWTILSKIKFEDDGFEINHKKFNVQDIVSISYRSYSPSNKNFKFMHPASRYEILLVDDLIYIFGKHINLSNFFDMHLEVESVFDDKIVGYIKRWKQFNNKYQYTSISDKGNKEFVEKMSNTQVSPNILWRTIKLGVSIIIIILVLFFIVLSIITIAD